MRRRSQAASIAYRPALISEIWRSSSVASLSSTIRSTVPPSLRTTRPRPVGSMASTETRAMAAWSSPRSSSSVESSPGLHQRARRPTRPGSPPPRRAAPRGRPGARRRSRAARPGAPRRPRSATASRTASVAGRVDDDGPAAGRGGRRVEHVVDHRAPAHRVEDLGHRRLHARAEAGREDDRDRPDLGASRDLRGSRGRAPAGSRPDRRRRCGWAGARWSVRVGHQEWRGFCGRSRWGVNRRRRTRRPPRVRAGSARRARGRGRRRSRAIARRRRRRLGVRAGAAPLVCGQAVEQVRGGRPGGGQRVQRGADRPVVVVQPAGPLGLVVARDRRAAPRR